MNYFLFGFIFQYLKYLTKVILQAECYAKSRVKKQAIFLKAV